MNRNPAAPPSPRQSYDAQRVNELTPSSDPESQEPESQEPESQEPESQEPESQEPESQGPREGWLLLVYRVPSEPSNNRVSVWRELKRLGALYLQQCVCVVPALPECAQAMRDTAAKIETLGGNFNLFPLQEVGPAEAAKLVGEFRQLAAKEYDEIVEECQTKFAKEIEFERFRENYTYEEAEEIREDLEKIRRWYDRVVARDWFDAGRREAVGSELARCEALLEAFEAEVYRRSSHDVEHTFRHPSGRS